MGGAAFDFSVATISLVTESRFADFMANQNYFTALFTAF